MAVWILEYITSGQARRQGDASSAKSLEAEGTAMLGALLDTFGSDPSDTISPIHFAWDASRPLPPTWQNHPRYRPHPLESDLQLQQWWQQAARDGRDSECAEVVIVAPETAGILEQLSRTALEAGCRLLSVDPDFIALCSDKTATQQRLAQFRVPVPTIRSALNELQQVSPLGWIVKPRDGCGSTQIQWWNRAHPPTPSDFPAASWQIESYCPGIPASVAVLSGPTGYILLPACRQCIDLPHDFHYRGGEYPLSEAECQRAHRLARQAVEALPKTHGYFGIDLILGATAQDDVVIEINPRVTTSIVALVQRVVPSLGSLWKAMVSGQPLDWQIDARPLLFSADGSITAPQDGSAATRNPQYPSVILGLDIGGANVKAASSRGNASSFAYALWRDPLGLAPALEQLIARWSEQFHEHPVAIALTMTGELADCYRTKHEGVHSIIDAVSSAAPELPLLVHSTIGKFLTPAQAKDRPLHVAAANWHATAQWIAIEARAGQETCSAELLIDMGSTTTDLIPIGPSGPIPRGSTDPARLASGELVYTGLERTAVAAIVRRLRYRGQWHGVAAETFATSLDAHLMIGNVAERPDDCETADARPATREYARDRLARMIGGDRDSVDDHDAYDLATQIVVAQRRQLRRSLEKVLRQMPAPPQRLWLAGHGKRVLNALLEDVLPDTPTVRLCEHLGTTLSRAAPAYAVARLALLEMSQPNWLDRIESMGSGAR